MNPIVVAPVHNLDAAKRQRSVTLLNHLLASIKSLPKFFALTLALAIGMTPPTAGAVSIVSIGNGVPAPDGSYQNASNIAQLLFFTNASIVADNEVRYLETVDIGTSTFGTNSFSIFNTAPKTSILGDVAIGNASFTVTSSLLDLAGSFSRVNGALNSVQLTGNATNVSVISNTASLQQAIYFTKTSTGLSTITAPFGSATSLTFDYDTKMILSGGLLSGAVAMNNPGSGLELHGHTFELDTGTGFSPFGSGSVSAAAGQLRGYLDSGDFFTVGFTQVAVGQITTFDSAVPLPSAVWLFGSGLLGLMGLARRKKK